MDTVVVGWFYVTGGRERQAKPEPLPAVRGIDSVVVDWLVHEDTLLVWYASVDTGSSAISPDSLRFRP